uniref:Uncharacterized protein n=1 Tax=Molossus molossus TaxID=27622 RepID=A0A7J8GKL2_MOLMO|nr:hypothetical protein HJG59_011421 [Molossus molossus]
MLFSGRERTAPTVPEQAGGLVRPTRDPGRVWRREAMTRGGTLTAELPALRGPLPPTSCLTVPPCFLKSVKFPVSKRFSLAQDLWPRFVFVGVMDSVLGPSSLFLGTASFYSLPVRYIGSS